MTSFTTRNDDDWKRPSPTLMTMRTVEVLLGTALLVIITIVILYFAASGGWAAGVIAIEAAVGLIWLILERRRVSSWAYCEREEELLVRRGLLIRRLSVVPYGRMQFIDVTAGPAERLFSLATVQLHTAAAETDARIPGLVPEEAARLRDQLARRGESRLSGL